MTRAEVGDDVADRERRLEIVFLAHRHRHECSERMLGMLVFLVEVAAQRAGAHCQNDVVERHARLLADGAHTGNGPGLRHEASRRRYAGVERSVRHVPPGHRQAVAQARPGGRVVFQHAQEMRRRVELLFKEVGDDLELELSRLFLDLVWAPVLCPDALQRLGRQRRDIDLGFGVRCAGAFEQARAGDAVDGGVVQFGVDRELAILQSLDHDHFPERVAAIEQRGVQPRDQRKQLEVAARLRQRRAPDVVVEVDLRVLFPVERAQTPKHAVADAVREGLAQLGGRAVGVGQPLKEFLLVDARRELEQVQARHVHRRFGALEIEKARVEKSDPVHADPPQLAGTGAVWRHLRLIHSYSGDGCHSG